MNIRGFNEKRFLAILTEIGEECACRKGYCFFRKLVETMHPDIRMLVQMKCIEKFKYEESERQGDDIGWHDAGMRWVDDGFAENFADVYDEELAVREVYKLTISKKTN